MVKCSVCDHDEEHGVQICSNCGRELDVHSTNKFDPPHTDSNRSDPTMPAAEMADAELRLSLQFYNDDVLVRFDKQGEFTLGRINEGQTVFPDIDLARLDAYKNGVSRIHAEIRIDNGKMLIKDLGSSNGTILNGRRLFPHVPFELNHGDHLVLGKLSSRVLIQHVQ